MSVGSFPSRFGIVFATLPGYSYVFSGGHSVVRFARIPPLNNLKRRAYKNTLNVFSIARKTR